MAEVVFRLPDLAEGLVDAEIVEWRVGEGDRVEVNQTLVEVFTEKVEVEIPSPHSGTVKVLHGSPGDKVRVGEPLVTFEVGDQPGVVGKVPGEEEPKRRVRLTPPNQARMVGLAGLAMVLLALASCGAPDVSDLKQRLLSTTADGRLLAEQAAAGRLTQAFVRVRAEEIAEDAASIGDEAGSATGPAGERHSVIADAHQVRDALERLVERPGDRRQAAATAADLVDLGGRLQKASG